MTKSARFKEIKDKLRVVHGVTITRRAATREFRVNFEGGEEATAYYTDDLEDAFATGVTMSLSKVGRVVHHKGDADRRCAEVVEPTAADVAKLRAPAATVLVEETYKDGTKHRYWTSPHELVPA